MALPAQQQVKYWGIAAALLLVVLWLLGNVLLPFILGGAIAYLLDPLADRLERLGLSRVMATVVITVLILFVALLALLLVVPTLIRQAIDLAETAPELARNLLAFFEARFPRAMEHSATLSETIPGLGDTIRERGVALLNGVLTSAMSIVNIVVLIFIVPVVSFYMLIDWDRMVASVDELVPLDHAPVVRRLASEIDRTLASFIRGQGMVCLIQGTFYSVALMLAGLNFGLVVGAVAGLISFIPYVGALVGGALAIGLAVFQFWNDPLMIALIAGIFMFGQLVEGNILTPKLVGGSVGLHPVWLLLALSIFGALFGFVGMLVAVPVSAMIGVIVRFFVAEYRTGRLYLGLKALERDAALQGDGAAAPDSAAKAAHDQRDAPET
ncbi:AI-2E family transporter [Meridianimarinicoccus roseus]|uniref:AI-2E family transporter n=1 Tax=Meridianimarinicoccus roseus TaxID=2072018 RepID=A0A2V2LKN1_9RHOB|nr:AI-2E family transporter [Meridianimarinicoccus roseus]PWR03756.1 AI-2E family transporter [Meridianimarinicoccus roseus]